jgi:hypothetical protein
MRQYMCCSRQVTAAGLVVMFLGVHCMTGVDSTRPVAKMSVQTLRDKMNGGWVGQMIGVTYGTPWEFRYNSAMMPDSVRPTWSADMPGKTYAKAPGAYDDLYVDLTFLEVYAWNRQASSQDYAEAFGKTRYWLWFANQMARNNIRNGIMPPQSGHWIRNPECTSIDFLITSDFIGLVNPGLCAEALALADTIGHITAYGDGYYGGAFISQMYAAAFLANDIASIVDTALAAIPRESLFYRMINDVIEFHRRNPYDWKANWQYIHDRYADENGSPFGVFDPWNIEASMNAAHVVTGLLYGDGDFGRTMEIAVRCGDDADCNPGTCAGILGAMKGLTGIPEEYKRSLPDVYDRHFMGSEFSLQDAVEICMTAALQNIEEAGGDVGDDGIMIVGTKAPVAALEVARPEHVPVQKVDLHKTVRSDDPIVQRYLSNEQKGANGAAKADSVVIATDLFEGPHEFAFEGNGYCTFGKVVSDSAGEFDFNDDSTTALVYVDGALSQRVVFPLGFEYRRFLAFFDYTLNQGAHTVRFEAEGKRPPGHRFELYHTILYSSRKP